MPAPPVYILHFHFHSPLPLSASIPANTSTLRLRMAWHGLLASFLHLHCAYVNVPSN
jgi:hypothetical protein